MLDFLDGARQDTASLLTNSFLRHFGVTMSAQSPSPPPFVPKKRSPALLIVLLVILGIGLGALVWDYKARYGFNQAKAALNEYFPETEPGPDDIIRSDLPAMKEIHEKIGRAPDASKPLDGGYRQVETYRWPGVFYVYTMRIDYTKGAGVKAPGQTTPAAPSFDARGYRSASVARFVGKEEEVIPEVEYSAPTPGPSPTPLPGEGPGQAQRPPGGGPPGGAAMPGRGGPGGGNRPGRTRPPGGPDDSTAPTEDPTAGPKADPKGTADPNGASPEKSPDGEK